MGLKKLPDILIKSIDMIFKHRLMKELGTALDVPIHVYGPETHMTAIVAMAMGKKEIVDPKEMMARDDTGGQNFSLPTMVCYVTNDSP